MDIYAAIDIRGGKCVNLIQGDFARETMFYEDPRDAVRYFLDCGTDWIHIVDLDAARRAVRTHGALVNEIIHLAGSVPVQVGGGIRDMQAVREVLDAGAARVVIGTAAVRDPGLIPAAVDAYPRQIAVGVDARNGQVAIEAWAEDSSISAMELAATAADAGAAALVFTDVNRDGMLGKPNFEGTAELVRRHGHQLDVIASGGVHSKDDVAELAELGASGVIIGRALYTGDVTLADARRAARS
ncbi:MAG: 1-(5-phosphoribosyl)-5-[(5-phosphoribosylamino)methylideneamino]imidazole-4-carboxamide isomerase [Chloroflexota bacterium]|nr:1-(5-phosphoribosyl)-5-[(5-phosphoribosylamino)methylideneamino]imidazole-4-carboxamide isomerase [Chloroflexota bacterium]MDE2898624.1 1-(5-phosphoribosyl)-5-[(5-phosphoribosylamino)methylideneamino]imidazole-4-carboxamide isomerase [Chloroflexota bacterium]